MTINFKTVLTDAAGAALHDDVARHSNGGVAVELTLGAACSHALLQQYVDEQGLTGEQKFKRAMLAVKVGDAAELTLPSEDISTLKDAVAKLYGPLVIYRAWILLDPALQPDQAPARRQARRA